MDFDFTAHLSKLLSIPTSQITIQFFTGGFANATVRASFNPPVDLTQFGHPQSVPSVVLKYAPPHMAFDPSVPLSTLRQDVEARALELLDPKSESVLAVSSLFKKYPNIKTPRFIHQDFQEHVLIMTDLGSVITIDDWLSQEPAPEPEDIESIAKDLGSFLADFVIATNNPSPELLSLASNSGIVEQFNSNAMDILRAVLLSEGIPDAKTLIKHVEDAIIADFGKTDACLGMVDLWRRNIVIDSDRNICLIDWENFGLSNASCEITLLGG
jgi:hypothetical protein